MSDYNPYTDGSAEPIGLAMDANGNLPPSSLAAMPCSTWFIGQTLPCKFDVSKAMLVLDVITTHEALQKSYKKTFWMKRKVWEEKHQRALDNHNEALRVLEVAMSNADSSQPASTI